MSIPDDLSDEDPAVAADEVWINALNRMDQIDRIKFIAMAWRAAVEAGLPTAPSIDVDTALSIVAAAREGDDLDVVR